MASTHIHPTQSRAFEPVRALPARPARRLVLAREIARYLGALSLFVVGAIHAQQYYDAYFSVVPTVGTLFLLNFVGAGMLGVVLIAPVRRLGRNVGDLILVLASLGAIGIALGSLVSLLISEYTPFFGFMESGYRLAVVLSLVFDALTTVFLGVFVLAPARARQHPDPSTAPAHTRRDQFVATSRGADPAGSGRHPRSAATAASSASPAAMPRIHPGRARR